MIGVSCFISLTSKTVLTNLGDVLLSSDQTDAVPEFTQKEINSTLKYPI